MHCAFSNLTTGTGYTEFVNILDFTSAVLPVTKADKNVDVAHGDFKPLTPNDEVNWRACK